MSKHFYVIITCLILFRKNESKMYMLLKQLPYTNILIYFYIYANIMYINIFILMVLECNEISG